MAAIIGLEVGEVTDVCDVVDGEVWVANDNAPGQVVIAGTDDGDRTRRRARQERGARQPMALPVAGAFHTPLMEPAQDALDTAIRAHRVPRGRRGRVGQRRRQLPLRRRRTGPSCCRTSCASRCSGGTEVLAMAARGVDRFVELGPGKVLTGMVKRIVPDAARASAATPNRSRPCSVEPADQSRRCPTKAKPSRRAVTETIRD